MVIKVYTSGISGNKEVKKRQQRILMILESKNVKYETIDITEPGNEENKHFMQEHAVAGDSKHPLPPQIFNEEEYCGDYVGFDLANENDELEAFLKMAIPPPPVVNGTKAPPEPTATEEPSDQRVSERNIDLVINEILPDTTTVAGGEEDVRDEKPEVEEEHEEEDMEDEQQELDSSMKDEGMEQEVKADEMEGGAEGEE